MSEYKKLTLNGTAFPKYESPIQVLFDDDCTNPIITEFEDAIVAQASQTLHIKIDKDELAKALAYDRGQYEKGYRDALARLEQPTVDAVPVEWINAKIESLESQGNMFASIAARMIKAMLNDYGADGERKDERN